MGLKLTLDFPQDNTHSGPYDVVLHDPEGGDGSIEIPGYDIDTDLAALELGFKVWTPQLYLYQHYTDKGLPWLVRFRETALYDAFEEQGYDVFEAREFSQREFFNDYLLATLAANDGDVEALVDLVEPYVNDPELPLLQPGTLVDADAYIEALITGLQADSDPEAHWSEGGNIPLYLDALLRQLPRDEFKFEAHEPWVDEPEYGEKTVDLGYSISVGDDEIVSWARSFDIWTVDPVWFAFEVRDRCIESDDPYACPPESANTIMDYFGWVYDDSVLDQIGGPEAPQSDPDGNFGVKYTHWQTAWRRDAQGHYVDEYRVEEADKVELVPYATESEAEAAVELSEGIFTNRGEDRQWDMDILQRVTGGAWVPIEEEA